MFLHVRSVYISGLRCHKPCMIQIKFLLKTRSLGREQKQLHYKQKTKKTRDSQTGRCHIFFISCVWENTKYFCHQIFGLTILPMKRMFAVLSMIRTINGRLNFNIGTWLKDKGIIPIPVAAAAVAPVSSTSKVAWCTTCRNTAEWD